MARSYQHVLAKTVIGWFALAVLFVCIVVPGGLYAQSISPPAGLVRSATITIEGKTTDAVISGERRFAVSESTAIIDAYGTRITLQDLSLPVEAQVRYELIMDQDPKALRIVLK